MFYEFIKIMFNLTKINFNKIFLLFLKPVFALCSTSDDAKKCDLNSDNLNKENKYNRPHLLWLVNFFSVKKSYRFDKSKTNQNYCKENLIYIVE